MRKVRVERWKAHGRLKNAQKKQKDARPRGQMEFARVHSRGEEGIRLIDNRASHVVSMTVSSCECRFISRVDSVVHAAVIIVGYVVVVVMKLDFDYK